MNTGHIIKVSNNEYVNIVDGSEVSRKEIKAFEANLKKDKKILNKIHKARETKTVKFMKASVPVLKNLLDMDVSSIKNHN